MVKPKKNVNSQKDLTRIRIMRDQTIKSIADIYSIAIKVDKGERLKEDLSVRMDKLDLLFEKFQEQQDSILDSLVELDEVHSFSVDSDIATSTENSYYDICSIAARVLNNKPTPVSTSDTPRAPTYSASVLSLPKIELPKFDGNLTQWRPFRDKFNSLIRRNGNLSPTDQFHYLLSCLSGPALSIINSLPLTESNYDIAWTTLSNRYENQRLLATAHLEKLFEFRPINTESLPALLAFVNIFQENIAAIKALGVVDLSDFILFFISSRLLDSVTRQLFEASISQDTVPTFDSLLTFVHQRCKILGNIKGSEKIDLRSQKIKSNVNPRSSLTITTSKKSSLQTSNSRPSSIPVDKDKITCAYCKHAHVVYRCFKFGRLPVNRRREFVLSHKLCFSCLSSFHMASECPSKFTCKTCNKKHHTILHDNNDDKDSTLGHSSNTDNTNNQTEDGVAPIKFSGTSCTNSTVLLGTAVVRVRDKTGDYQYVRVLLDSGSQISAVTSECAARLGLVRRRCRIEIVGLAQNPVAQVKGSTTCTFLPYHSVDPILSCEDLVILPRITSSMPVVPLPPEVRLRYKHLTLADPKFDTPAGVDMLIGGDIFPHLVRPKGEILHTPGLPSALNTFLGWVVFGAVAQYRSSPSVSLTATSIPSISESLRKFWTIEEPDTSPPFTTEDQLCEELFADTTQRSLSGQFCVSLPFRNRLSTRQSTSLDTRPESKTGNASSPSHHSSTHGLGESRSMALKRFYNLERKLVKNPPLYNAYRKFMADYETLGHMEIAKHYGIYFIPHHAVLKSDGDFSKLRVVFDASAPTSSGLSLNDVLCTGPKLQTDIRDILLRNRLSKYIFTADIVKMYRQILIKSEDRLYQHILWRNSPDEEIKEFELLTITYGVNSAPYLAIRCLHELEAREGHRFPLAKGILTKSTYVDDIVAGANTEEDLLRIQDQIVGLLRTGGFELKKWTSNCSRVLRQIPVEDRVLQTSFDPKDDHSVRVLGLHWDTLSDQFAYHTHTPESQRTKRKVLSVIARLFDPIGALGPMLMWAKGFMQELWQDNMQWDDPLTPELSATWGQFLSELPSIKHILLPRHIDIENAATIQLLGFSDASKKGYAATAYLRIQYQNDEVKVYFLATKTKVAPLKCGKVDESLSIPRLELCAALLLAQLLERLYTVLQTEILINHVHAWTDSTIVLSWLTVDQKQFKIFVTNRVAKIHKLIPGCQWTHISTHENPADPASRGLLPSTMLTSTLYWNGPAFLLLPEAQWPNSIVTPLSIDCLPETKTSQVLALQVNSIHSIEPFQRFSSLIKMQRVLSYCLRFIRRAQNRPSPTGPITRMELNYILITTLKKTQNIYFSTLIKQVKGSQIISPASLAQLAPFIDPDGLVRVGGRLRFSSLSEDAKHPILLPSNAHITTLLIRHYHLSFLHGGPKLILAMISHKFWILSGRDAIRRYIFSCVPCTRHKANHPKPFMSDLPSSRVQPHRPFLHVGMDYGGPFTIKECRRRKARTSKVYLALFICMSVKAVHLEIVSDLSTNAFLTALDRFVARRGIPAHLYSDCGTNYVGAARQLKTMFEDGTVQDKVISHLPCTWHFNPPAAPHFGGLWESAIKSTKFHLKHVIGQQVLTFEELHTLVTRIEGILNSRPLTQASTDPHDLCALTPGHFLIGQALQTLPEPDLTTVPLNQLDRWQLIRQCHQSFWKRWAKEYLTTLQGQKKWFHKSRDVAQGDMVIVEAPNRPPADWRLGCITEVHPGTDDTVRVATIRTHDGLLKRPVVKLVRLPIEH